jgi:threonine/homoserine/homoserine lactone efflux protein
MFSLYLSVCIFAFVASITPGPTNLLAFANGNRFGVKATLPFIIGSATSAASILLLITTDLAQFLMDWVWLQQAFGWVGTLWLSSMAYSLYQAPVQVDQDSPTSKTNIGLKQGFGLQLVNPKVWLTAFTVGSVFALQADTGISVQQHFSLLALMFFIITCPCLSVWAILGKAAEQHIQNPNQQRHINKALALLLALTIWFAQINTTLDMFATTGLMTIANLGNF